MAEEFRKQSARGAYCFRHCTVDPCSDKLGQINHFGQNGVFGMNVSINIYGVSTKYPFTIPSNTPKYPCHGAILTGLTSYPVLLLSHPEIQKKKREETFMGIIQGPVIILG